MDRRPAAAEDRFTVLDRRDIQTLMYCIRVAETQGLWQPGQPARTPNELECKLAALLREVDRAPGGVRRMASAA